ncbi:hypothetical protein AALP_AA8G496800 [Arabis alpina]|uniref:Uncharacterized protein n=1 Tax=Arabis alpina TaxID=50452 RepID=A0A087GEI5_ARAAL|nr:hypothetical protein AALP_AA8G496800 [Arabis alpina]
MLSPTSSSERFLESISKLRTTSLESLGPGFEINRSDAESSSWLRPCKNREVTRVLVSDVSDAANAHSPFLLDEQVTDFRSSPNVKAEQNEYEINERFDLALFLRKQKSPTHGRRRARKFRPPDPPGSTLSTERSLSLLRKKLNIPNEIELVVPEPHERADDPPEEYFTLYESFLEVCFLWFPVTDRPNTEGSEQLKDSLGFAQRSRVQLEERLLTTTCRESESFPRGSLVPRTTGSGKPPTPTTVSTSAAPTVVPAPAEPTAAPAFATPTTAPASAKLTTVPTSSRSTIVPPSEPRDASSAKKTTTTAKGSRLPAPLSSDHDAKRTAKGKGHEGDDRKRSSDRDDVIDMDRVSKKARAISASPPRRVSRSVFQDKASASSLFSTLVFHDDYVAPINTESSRDMMRQGLRFLGLVNMVGHELEAKVEVLKEKLEAEMLRTENARTAAEGLRVKRNAAWASIDKKNDELTDQARAIILLKAEARKSAEALVTEAERSAIALAAAEEREQCLAVIVMKRDGELATVVEKLRKADGHIQSLERKLTRAKNKFDELQGDPRSNMVYQVQKDEERFERLMTSLHGLLHVLYPKVKAPTVVAHDRTLETYVASVGVVDPSGSLLGGVSSCKAAVVGVDGKFSLIGRVGAEVTKSRIDNVAEGAGTVGAPE